MSHDTVEEGTKIDMVVQSPIPLSRYTANDTKYIYWPLISITIRFFVKSLPSWGIDRFPVIFLKSISMFTSYTTYLGRDLDRDLGQYTFTPGALPIKGIVFHSEDDRKSLYEIAQTNKPLGR